MRASDRVYEELRREIIEGSLQPGTVLAEVEQATRLGVSRTPVREAISRLGADGFVVPLGQRGTVVSAVSAEAVRGLFEVRTPLEAQAAALAAGRRDVRIFEELRAEFTDSQRSVAADDDPHRRGYYDLVGRLDRAIDDAARNPYLTSLLEGVRAHIARLRHLSRDDPRRLTDAATEHLMIIDAIIDGSPHLAAYATELHLGRSLANILRTMDSPAAASAA